MASVAPRADIQYFKDAFLKKGVSRPNRFLVTFNAIGASEINFPAETVSLPSKSFETIDEQWYGPIRNIPIGVKFESSVLITYPVSEDQSERGFFEEWMDQVVDPETNENKYKAIVQGGLGSSMEIATLDMANEVTSTFKFTEVYPSNIIPTQYSAATMNDYQRITVQMNYRSYTYKRGSG